jgi:hypothetical protein
MRKKDYCQVHGSRSNKWRQSEYARTREILRKALKHGGVGVGAAIIVAARDGLEQWHVTARMQMAQVKRIYGKVLGH